MEDCFWLGVLIEYSGKSTWSELSSRRYFAPDISGALENQQLSILPFAGITRARSVSSSRIIDLLLCRMPS